MLRPHCKTVHRPGNWVEDAWLLYGAMEGETTVHFDSQSENPVTLLSSIVWDPIALLRNIIRRKIAPALVTSNRAPTSSEEATEAICALSKAVLHLGMTNFVSELRLAE